METISLLPQLMEASGYQIALAEIIARTAWTTIDLLEAVQAQNLRPEWDFITLCIGVNNQYQNLNRETFRQDLSHLVQKAKALRADENSCLLLLSIPDWSVSPFATDREPEAVAKAIDAFNAVVEEVASTLDVPFIDWTPVSRQFGKAETGFTTDQLHPDFVQYSAWAAFLIKYLHGA